jgi:hypothetical protein
MPASKTIGGSGMRASVGAADTTPLVELMMSRMDSVVYLRESRFGLVAKCGGCTNANHKDQRQHHVVFYGRRTIFSLQETHKLAR